MTEMMEEKNGDETEKMEQQKTNFGNPVQMITDRGISFTSQEFEKYCTAEGIRRILIKTGLPRANLSVVGVEKQSVTSWELTGEGNEVVKHGSHEMQVFRNVPPEGILLTKLMQCLPDKKICSVGFNKAMAAGWLSVDKTQKEPLVTVKTKPMSDIVQEHLKDILNDNAINVPLSQKQDYKKRKLIQDVIITNYIIRKGEKFTTELQKEANDLTVEMLNSGSWKGQQFKPYNFNALGTPPPSGHLHPLLKVRAEVRKIFLEMGFQEMPTNNYVESSFWNFDALFQPQQHPARDAHDTFFISEPATSKNFPKDYMQRVKKVHSEGGYGSQGYGYEWKEEEASKNLLRTHTTAVSARMLYKIAQEGFQPTKYFSIDKVFRNESLDATHLAEFHQVEGVIADYNLNLGSLIGTLSTFFSKLGIEKLEFKPAYNPYTEPSMEIFGYHEGLGKMMEVGNSGIFRPEMLLPMGLPEEVTVIAWGLSLERPTMIKYGINNIRDLVGPKVDLKMVYDNPICRLDK
ncbi:Phenylalanine--tRNA ligase alpha subunit [Gryllus bimaculatus]|nr:Phenylalanine--tRNA ligase alpha subunit [Gryllus bimaculatus]